MTLRVVSGLIGLVVSLLLQGAALAQPTTYVYSGTNYVAPTGTFTTGMRISGSFTTANPLPANMPFTAIGPAGDGRAIAWSFSNGISTFTQANSSELYGQSSYFGVATDSLGNISTYTFGLVSPLPPHSVGTTIEFMYILANAQIQALNQAVCAGVTANLCTNLPFAGTGTVAENAESGSFRPNFQAPQVPVPTLSEGALFVLAALLGLLGLIGVNAPLRSARPDR
ncbi:MAG: hypothetical protein GZ089_10355 [Aromatoleum sp.]|nr:hypothetical protein [Aromatoleum sp.]